MRVVIQRVRYAKLFIDEKEYSSIDEGLMVLLGITHEDNIEDVEWLCKKISLLRVFPDDEGVMNRSVQDCDAEIMVVSQFTLHASTKKGNRPSYIYAAPPDIAIPLYEELLSHLAAAITGKIASGKFGAMMDIEMINYGPVTIFIDTKNRE